MLKVSFLVQREHWFPGAALTKSHINLAPHSSRGPKSKIKVSTGLCLLEGSEEDLSPASLLVSAGLLVILGVPWLVVTELQSLHDVLPVCMSGPKFSIFMGTPYWLRVPS